MIRAGKLRKRVEIQQPIVTRAPNGEKLEEWQTVARRNVRIREERRPTGSESFYENYQERAITRYQISLRWERRLKTLSPLWRLKAGDTIYELEAVNNVEDRNREYLVRATAEF